ncbi:MAG: 2-hydroxyacyl-CoA dehydratase [Desulfobacter sp.]|nr:MAG: 2-hydroxyacyl-CoA dehydratase [Desulfobacter sp.]
MNLKPFTLFSEQSLADLDQWQEEGRKIAGVYCIYAPNELIRAAGIAPVSLCGKKQAPIQAAEKELPPSFCPLVKSSYGYAVTDTCPFFSFSDILIAETTCDGKKKMYEQMGRLKPLHLMHLPHTQAGPSALAYWKQALYELAEFLTGHSGIQVTEEALKKEIRLQNRIREALYQVSLLAADSRSPVTTAQMLAIQESKSFAVYPKNYLERLMVLKAELEADLERPGLPVHTGPRILLTGCPVGKGCEKVLQIIEALGARVVCMENCTGLKGMSLAVDETGDPWEAIARRYLEVPCSCMTPNPGRPSSVEQMAEAFRVDAVIDMTWLGCHTYNAESLSLGQFVETKLGLPFLHVETDYSASDQGQLRTRIEAMIELLE